MFPTTRTKLLKTDLSHITFDSPEIATIREDKEIESLVKLVMDGFGKKNATTLTIWSHQSGSPWDRVSSQEGFTWGEQIPDEYIMEYFNSIIIRNDKR